MGANVGSQNYGRISKAFQSHYSSLSNAKGAHKDHKPEDPEFGSPMHIMMDGKKGPNGPLANIQLPILRLVRKALNQQVGTELLNTEKLCHHMINHNQRVVQETPIRIQPKRGAENPPLQTPEFVVGSMDLKALYPNCKKVKSAAKIVRAFILTNLDFKN